MSFAHFIIQLRNSLSGEVIHCFRKIWPVCSTRAGAVPNCWASKTGRIWKIDCSLPKWGSVPPRKATWPWWWNHTHASSSFITHWPSPPCFMTGEAPRKKKKKKLKRHLGNVNVLCLNERRLLIFTRRVVRKWFVFFPLSCQCLWFPVCFSALSPGCLGG